MFSYNIAKYITNIFYALIIELLFKHHMHLHKNIIEDKVMSLLIILIYL